MSLHRVYIIFLQKQFSSIHNSSFPIPPINTDGSKYVRTPIMKQEQISIQLVNPLLTINIIPAKQHNTATTLQGRTKRLPIPAQKKYKTPIIKLNSLHIILISTSESLTSLKLHTPAYHD